MANGQQNRIAQALIDNLFGSKETGRGLLSPANIGEALKFTGQDLTAAGQATGLPGVAPFASIPTTILPKINVTAKRLPPEEPTVNVRAAQQEAAMNAVNQLLQEDANKDSKFKIPEGLKKFIKQAGVPLAAAILGGTRSEFLPAAAGFAKGFTEQKVEQQKPSRRFKVFDEKGNIIIDQEIGEKDIARLSKPGLSEEQIGSILGNLIGFTQPMSQPKTTEQITEEVKTKFKVGDITEKGGQQYEIVGFDEDGEPLVRSIE